MVAEGDAQKGEVKEGGREHVDANRGK